MVASPRQLPIPGSLAHVLEHAGEWDFDSDHLAAQRAARAMKAEFGYIAPAHLVATPIVLILIDVLRDFLSKSRGKLYCGSIDGDGGTRAARNITAHLFQEAHRYTWIERVFDRHIFGQISSSEFLITRQGYPVAIGLEIDWDPKSRTLCSYKPMTDEIVDYDVRPNPDLHPWVAEGESLQWLYAYCVHYCQSLKAEKKPRLMMWPPHCQVGTIGQTFDGAIDTAMAYFAHLRGVPPVDAPKADRFLSEVYGAFQPEVMFDHRGKQLDRPKIWLHERHRGAKRAYVGVARGHCFGTAIKQDVEYCEANGLPTEDIYVLTDCTADVVLRDAEGNITADFTEQGDRLMEWLKDHKVNFVESTTPMHEWPNMEHLRVVA